jgi:DNA-binding NtrC family response regulator
MMSKERGILIIDPDRKERQDLTAFLRKENYYVESGEGLPDAIMKLSEGCFKCLIMDVDLPEMKGYEAVSILKNIDPDIKIIMTTKKNSKRLEAKVREQDIFFYFIKSFGEEELKMAISNALVK